MGSLARAQTQNLRVFGIRLVFDNKELPLTRKMACAIAEAIRDVIDGAAVQSVSGGFVARGEMVAEAGSPRKRWVGTLECQGHVAFFRSREEMLGVGIMLARNANLLEVVRG